MLSLSLFINTQSDFVFSKCVFICVHVQVIGVHLTGKMSGWTAPKGLLLQNTYTVIFVGQDPDLYATDSACLNVTKFSDDWDK